MSSNENRKLPLPLPQSLCYGPRCRGPLLREGLSTFQWGSPSLRMTVWFAGCPQWAHEFRSLCWHLPACGGDYLVFAVSFSGQLAHEDQGLGALLTVLLQRASLVYSLVQRSCACTCTHKAGRLICSFVSRIKTRSLHSFSWALIGSLLLLILHLGKANLRKEAKVIWPSHAAMQRWWSLSFPSTLIENTSKEVIGPGLESKPCPLVIAEVLEIMDKSLYFLICEDSFSFLYSIIVR